MPELKAKIMNISRHRMGTDGAGVSSLVAFWGCPLHCRYCINDFCHDSSLRCLELTPEELYERVKIDDIYYRMTKGGIVFGGGEPLLQAEYIFETVKLFPKEWMVRIETSLNVSAQAVELLLPVVDQWIIDIKDMNPEIYRQYTGQENTLVFENLKRISRVFTRDKLVIRIPFIPGYNTDADILYSKSLVKDIGIIDTFTYKTAK